MSAAVHHGRAPSHSSSHSHGDSDEKEYFFTIPSLGDLKSCLDDENAPIAKRMRTVFLLKQVGGAEAVETLYNGLKSPSVLLAHECAYVLGQMQEPMAIPVLEEYLANTKINPIVRHECAEALAAIGDPCALPALRLHCADPAPEVSETCLIAVAKLEYVQAHGKPGYSGRYMSVDPAPPVLNKTIPELDAMLMDTSLSLFERYRAMFALRDEGSEAAIMALARGFQDKSAVFRHEVAYVMGQIQHPAALAALQLRLSDHAEHAMVRHEAAEAIGSIAETDCEPMLKGFAEDKDAIVRESCDVALDLVEYWNNDEVSSALPQETHGEPEKDNKEKKSDKENNKDDTKGIADGIATVAFVRRAKPAQPQQ